MSTLTIKYFGVVAEITERMEEKLEVPNEISLAEFLDLCIGKYPGLKDVSFKVAHNQKIVDSGIIKPADEIALLPPFSGG